MVQANSSAEVREYIREKIRAGKFLIKSLHQRQQTILNIAREIVKRQRDFMDKGVAYLKPLTMVQVAEVVGVHESTVSRAVSAKYMETPQGIFEMKYFFSSLTLVFETPKPLAVLIPGVKKDFNSEDAFGGAMDLLDNGRLPSV